MNSPAILESVSDITPDLKELHRLLVELCIHFKVLLYIFKAWRGQAPQYLGQVCCYKQRPSLPRQPRNFSLQVPLTQRSATEVSQCTRACPVE